MPRPGRTLLLVSGMYPSPRAPYYGAYVHRFCEAATRIAGLNYIEAVSRRPVGRGPGAGAAKNAALLARAVWVGATRPYDAVHGHYAYPAGWIAAVVARIFSRPLLITCHGSDVAGLAERSARERHRVGFALRRAGRVIAVSRHVRAEIERCFGAGTHRIAVISMGVDLERFHPRTGPGAPADGGPTIFAAGNLVAEKGFGDLLDALATPGLQAGGARLVLAGDGPLAGSLRGRAAALGVEDRVRFLGAVPHEQMADRIRGADVVAVPSRREGLGLVALETLACGVPLVASAVGGLAEIVTDGENGSLVPPGRPAALAAALDDVLGSPAKRQRYTAAGLETAKRYELGAEVRRMVEQVEGLLDASR